MTRKEQIISEAKKYYLGNMRCYDAFLHGVEFADEHPKNIWHDASEEPQENEYVLIQNDENNYDVVLMQSADGWNTWCGTCKIIRWAYIDDLIPKGDKK